VAGIVDVAVSAPVIVAALGNGNDIVGVIDAVNDHATGERKWSTTRRAPDVMRVDELIDGEHYVRGTELLERIVAMLTKLRDPGFC
jgi:hypothetical protein